MCCGSTRQKGRVKNRRNSDRIGWNSMWDNATRLNNQSLSSLGVHSGGLIHCAVRIRPAHSLVLRSTARQHTPPTQARPSPTLACCLSIPAPTRRRTVCRRCARPVTCRRGRCAVTTSTRPSRRTCTANWLTSSGIRSGWARPTPTKARPTPAASQISRRECARRGRSPPNTHNTPRCASLPTPLSVPSHVGPDAAAPVPPAQVRLSHHDNAPALRHACGAGVLVRRRPDPLAPGHLVAVVPPHGGARRHARRLPRADRSERRRHLATDSSPCVDACPLDATPPYPHHGTPHPVLPKPHPA